MLDSLSLWLSQTLMDVLQSFAHNWPILLVGTFIAALIQVFVTQDKIVGFLRRHSKGSIFVAVLAATLTPLCSCGTMAVILSMMASVVPWGPIVAFMVSSPLTSPSEFVYFSGFLGVKFAAFHLAASIALGLGAGFLADRLEKSGFLANQARHAGKRVSQATPSTEAAQGTPAVDLPLADPGAECGCGSVAPVAVPTASCGCGTASSLAAAVPPPAARIVREMLVTAKHLIPAWVVFAGVGYGLINALPAGAMERFLGSNNAWSVPVAALVGLPLYFSAETSVPLLGSLVAAGMSQGAAMAFMITGPATSIGAIAGALTVARGRVVGLILATILVGGLLAGYLFQWLL